MLRIAYKKKKYTAVFRSFSKQEPILIQLALRLPFILILSACINYFKTRPILTIQSYM